MEAREAARWPTVDCGALLARDDTVLRKGELGVLRAALETRGFFYCANIDALMDAEYLGAVYEYARRAHGLPPEVKRRHARPHGGYTGADVGVPELAYEAGKPASVSAWDFARENNSFVATEAGADASKYPSEAVLSPSFESFVGELFDRQQKLGVALLEAFAEMLGLQRNTFSRHMLEGGNELGTVRLLHYPKRVETPGIGAHTDFEVFTLMHQSAPGLQLRAVGEVVKWEDAPVRPGEFVVIIGDVLERLTNGVLRATPHRVLPNLAEERYSIIRFNALAADVKVAPLPAFVTADRPAAYGDTTMAEIMKVTIGNLEAGLGAWDHVRDGSSTVSYDYGAKAGAAGKEEL